MPPEAESHKKKKQTLRYNQNNERGQRRKVSRCRAVLWGDRRALVIGKKVKVRVFKPRGAARYIYLKSPEGGNFASTREKGGVSSRSSEQGGGHQTIRPETNGGERKKKENWVQLTEGTLSH